MSYLFPRFAYAPTAAVRYAGAATPSAFRHDFAAPLFSLFDESMRELNALSAHHQQAVARRSFFNPRFDLKEDKESYVLEGEVPGFQEADLTIEWHNDTLAVRGRHESVKESGTKPTATAEADKSTESKAIQDGTAHTVSAAESVKSTAAPSHQATVEDDVEHPANASPVAEAKTTTTTDSNQVATSEETTTPSQEIQKQAKQETPQHWISERTTGEFLRKFRFPSNTVNHDAIKASLESGILRVVVPKHAEQATRKINIE